MAPGPALVLPGDVERYAMVVLAKALRPTMLPWFAGAQSLPSGGSLRDHFGFPAQCSLADLQAAVSALGAGDVALPANLDQPLSEAERRALTPASCFVLMALSGVLNRCPVRVWHGARKGPDPESWISGGIPGTLTAATPHGRREGPRLFVA